MGRQRGWPVGSSVELICAGSNTVETAEPAGTAKVAT